MTTAAIYARQSLDRTGETLAVSRQLERCRAFCEARGWTVAGEFVDNDTSATSGAARPEFEALLASRPARIVVWHTDRLVRLTKDLERVIDLGVSVHAVEAGDLDLSNAAGRAVARTITAWATYEGEQKATRQRASNDQRAALGLPPTGRRLYGYDPTGMEIVPEEAAATRQAVADVLSGVPLRTVLRAWNAEGRKTIFGNPWAPTEVRRYLTNPRLAALRVHRREVVGPGVWPPILSEDEHLAVVAVLNDPARRPKGRPNVYLLSGVARCGVCDGRIYGRVDRRGPVYYCEGGGHVSRRIDKIDRFVTDVVLERLTQPDAARAFTAPDHADRAEALRTERRTLTERLDSLAEAFAVGEVNRAQLRAGTERLNTRIAEIDAEMPRTTGHPALEAVITAQDVRAAWDELDTATRRDIIRAVTVPVIMPAGQGKKIFDPASIVFKNV